MPGKLGRTSKERNALLRGLASQLLWYGKIETTAAKAKELRSYVEKLITKAVNTYDDVVEYEVTKKDAKGKEITVTNEVGLHARPATFFVQKANTYKCSIWVEKEDCRVNAKSLLGVLSLGIVKGTTITLIADGNDEAEAIDGLVALVDGGFPEL